MARKKRILAVDDNSISLATIEQELEGVFEVIPLNSGIRALQYLAKEKPDLILLDIQMKKMDGIETLAEIRQMEGCEDIPVIMLTSNADKRMVLESSRLNIDDYILKPFKKQHLCRRIDNVLNKESGGKRAEKNPDDAYSLLELEKMEGDSK